ncbi:MAG: PQQ-dependent sugar dehydrogenase [Chitinophagaceae bacterium]
MLKLFFSSVLFLATTISLIRCSNAATKNHPATRWSNDPTDSLPLPFATKSVQNFSKVIGWPEDKTPIAPPGFKVTKFADALDNPRWIYEGSNGDIFISESNTILKGLKKLGAKLSRKIKTQNYGTSRGRITMFRDEDKDGVYEKRYVFAEGLNQPFGMLILDQHFYVADTDALLRFGYNQGDTSLKTTGEQIVTLPAGGYNNHWTRNIISNKKGDKIYISVGSASNVGEHGMKYEERRANILEVNLDGTNERIYASGLRNPVGMDWAPGSDTLWTAVNERDELGDELVPDYITSVKDGGFYGWPYFYYGKNIDPRKNASNEILQIDHVIVPDVSLGSHTASLGLAFYDKKEFPLKYHNGAFVGQHGSWNRSSLSGYKVVFVPFANGRPSDKPEDFLTGFISDASKSEVYGRPVCVVVLTDGSMLVSDDVSNVIWRVSILHN